MKMITITIMIIIMLPIEIANIVVVVVVVVPEGNRSCFDSVTELINNTKYFYSNPINTQSNVMGKSLDRLLAF